MKLVHLHGHSHYSLLEAIGSPSQIIATAKSLGMEAIAMTDYHAIYGVWEFYHYCKKEQIKPIIGMDITLVQDFGITTVDLKSHVVLLCANYEGYLNLLKLTSQSYTQWFLEKPRIDYNVLDRYHKGLIMVIGGNKSLIAGMIQKDIPFIQIKDTLQFLSNLMPWRVFLEITAQDYLLEPQYRSINTTVLQLAAELQLPVTITNNYHYIKSTDQENYEVALAIKDQRQRSDPLRRKIAGQYHIMSEEEIVAIMLSNGYEKNTIDTWIANTQRVAELIDLVIPKSQPLFPLYTNPPAIQDLYQEFIASTS